MRIEEVAAMAMALPEVTVEERFGNPAWSVAGKVFAWVRAFSKADIKRYGTELPPAGPIVAVRVDDLAEKEAVLAAGHKGFFTIPHFDGYAAVLVELPKVSKRVMRETLLDGWLACAPRRLSDEYVARKPRRGSGGESR